MLELKKLSPEDGADVYELLQQIPGEENGLHNSVSGMSFDEYKAWLKKQYALSRQEGLIDGWKVPTTTFWLYADGVPVGFGKLRHTLTEALRREGGHIGYGIAAPYRGKGYGKALLGLLLEKAREMGIGEALVTVRADNAASRAVALANGGRITEKTDERVWIRIPTRK